MEFFQLFLNIYVNRANRHEIGFFVCFQLSLNSRRFFIISAMEPLKKHKKVYNEKYFEHMSINAKSSFSYEYILILDSDTCTVIKKKSIQMSRGYEKWHQEI